MAGGRRVLGNRPAPQRPAIVDEGKSGELPDPSASDGNITSIHQLAIDETELIILEKVGEGVTAEVFRGEYQGHDVAIKELGKKKTAITMKDQILLAREVMINARVSDEHLVKFFGVCIGQNFRIVSEFCSGGTCFDLFHNRKKISLSWPQRHKIVSDVACGMKYLHEFVPQIIHRDLKSLNLLLVDGITNSNDIPHVKVTDFGLARMREANEIDCWVKLTPATGTCHWMAPEVFGSNYDVKVDVYSFAMVLYEAICRRVPFQEVETALVEKYAKQGIRPSLAAVPTDCPPQLKELMVQCWAQSATERPRFGHIVRTLKSLDGADDYTGSPRNELQKKSSFQSNASSIRMAL
mmetsp:Transcript_31705/g.74062  ORF Transcript_31705/g.74062 Transcript_31705/m.74062 type:complete len:352 (+) Transcript_31705:134-1189(+)